MLYDNDVSVQAAIPTRSWSIRVFDFIPFLMEIQLFGCTFQSNGKDLTLWLIQLPKDNHWPMLSNFLQP